MRLWRISAYTGLAGSGGLALSGRWHSAGRPILYLAEHPALAMAEVLAHMRLSASAIPITLKLIGIDIADGASLATTPALATGWQANEPTTQALGDAWLRGNAELLMPVPSAILAHSTNYLLNPRHPQLATHVTEALIDPFWFDKRYLL